MKNFRKWLVSVPLLVLWLWGPVLAETQVTPRIVQPPNGLMETVTALASVEDRSTGTPGAGKAVSYIKKRFAEMGFDQVGSHLFKVPVRINRGSTLFLPEKGTSVPLHPMRSNLISPETIPKKGMEGPLVYVGAGELKDFNGKEIAGSIILMELESGKNWLHAASLGAKALIYLDRGPTLRAFFEEKVEMTPIQFPQFHLPLLKARELFGPFEESPEGMVLSNVRLTSDIKWEEVTGENVYCLIEGTHPERQEELVLVEAFYDSTAHVYGQSPGADEAISVATLLEVARNLKETPPERTVLLIATGGHAQSLAGMRELIWSLRARSKDLRKMQKGLQAMVKKSRESIEILGRFDVEIQGDKEFGRKFQEAIGDRIKTEVDSISRRLMRLRMHEKEEQNQDLIQEMAGQRLLLRRLSWRKTFQDLSPKEQEALHGLIPLAIKDHEGILSDAQGQLKMLKDARAFRALVKQRDLAAVVSLHLSSHGDGMGAFNQGWLYHLKPTINRIAAYSKLEKVLSEGALEWERSLRIPSLFRDTLRPSKRRSWQSYFIDRPPLGGEVSALAGYLGVSLVTVQDARQWWGTPYDFPEKVNWEYASQQGALVTGLVRTITGADVLQTTEMSKVGFSTVTGEAKFLRHGELFPDQPAPGSMILAYQGPGHYYAMVDSMGVFRLKGMADKRHVYDKVIIEGYKFDPEKGIPIWAIDKKQTGKDAYRLKMYRRSMKTKLVMFASKSTTLFNLLEPRSFRYMTKINVLDGRREAKPLRYWWSRIDTRSSILAMINLDEGTPLKFLLSDTVLRKKLILINADKERPHGVGYLVDDWPVIHNTPFRVANDMWALLGPRIANLEARGIFNERINKLRQEGVSALNEAKATLEAKQYDRFVEASSKSWALASRVYDDVEKTQKDVLFGVLFYIALFVPFAFCAERFLFSYTNIHKRIIAFCGILLLLIAIIYQVHPAFHLAYSPMVVILAFFIIGLSLIVTLIIFFRFEEEMTLLQSRAKHMKVGEVNRWKAFAAAFFLGVANLRRRRLRTILTCVTLIILTFTIMSFTSVKSTRHHSRIQYKDSAPYEGFLFKNFNWRAIPSEAIGVLSHTFEKDEGMIAPRVWLESEDLSRPRRVPVRFKDQAGEALGLVGLSAAEVPVSGIDSILAGGKWFDKSDTNSVILPDRMAQRLGIDSKDPEGSVVQLWGMPFKVVGTFYGQQFKEKYDLDGEPLTPVTFPHEASMKITEAEMEAMESEEDVQAFQSRYQHVPGEQTLIIPYRTLLALGGRLKSIAVRPGPGIEIQELANRLVDRFGLSLFSGEKGGTFLYAASDTLGYSGVPNILIPLLISVFIVLNTMISSVYERKREIAIYTSVGLAPSHVSFLFIAEALAFAVLSVVLGYILAQTSASIFSGTSLWAGITVNYSSLAGVAAMILVILVVLISVIYPSRVAAEIAIPDVNRAWKLPKTDGNVMEVMLPVQLKYKEYKGVGGYVFKYLLEHQNVSHGLFSTGDISIASICPILHGIGDRADECTDDSCCTSLCLNFKARVWLAPFDFGITQKVDVQFCPAPDDPDYLGIKVNLEREAGEANAWRRINKAFLNQMRKQLLMWRSIEKEAQDEYEEVLESPQEGKEGEDFSL
jgi:hypothetical protein